MRIHYGIFFTNLYDNDERQFGCRKQLHDHFQHGVRLQSRHIQSRILLDAHRLLPKGKTMLMRSLAPWEYLRQMCHKLVLPSGKIHHDDAYFNNKGSCQIRFKRTRNCRSCGYNCHKICHVKYTAQGRRKVLKSGGARYIAASLRANFKVIFVSFSQKTGGARAPPAPPVPPATFSIKFHNFHH